MTVVGCPGRRMGEDDFYPDLQTMSEAKAGWRPK